MQALMMKDTENITAPQIDKKRIYQSSHSTNGLGQETAMSRLSPPEVGKFNPTPHRYPASGGIGAHKCAPTSIAKGPCRMIERAGLYGTA